MVRREKPRWSTRLDGVIRRESTWLNLAVLHLYTHPRLPRVFPSFLLSVYHGMRTAISVMEAALERSEVLAPSCAVAERLAPYWARHLREEAGHDAWLLEDMRRLGLDIDRLLTRPPNPHIAELIGTLHFWIRETHPLAAVGYFFLAERTVPNEAMVDLMARSAGVRSEDLAAFHRHAGIDVAHGRELEQLVDSLPLTPPQWELLILSATTTIRQVERHVTALIEQMGS